MKKALIVKEDGLIYAAEVPEEPKHIRELPAHPLAWNEYETALTSAKESSILCADQEKAMQLIFDHNNIRGVGVERNKWYPIPDLQWEVVPKVKFDEKAEELENDFSVKAVAILKESTPSQESPHQIFWKETARLMDDYRKEGNEERVQGIVDCRILFNRLYL